MWQIPKIATSGIRLIYPKQSTNPRDAGVCLVLMAGLEPARPHGQGILSPRRLPFRHISVNITNFVLYQTATGNTSADLSIPSIRKVAFRHFVTNRQSLLVMPNWSGDCPRGGSAPTHVRFANLRPRSGFPFEGNHHFLPCVEARGLEKDPSLRSG